MNSGSRIIVAVIIFLAGLVAGWGVTRFVPLPLVGVPSSDGGVSTSPVENGELDNRNVSALGRLEPAGGVLMVSATPGDRLKSLSVVEGQTIQEQGKQIGELESYDLHEFEVKSFDARLKEAAARESAETNTADSQIITAELALEQAKSKTLELESQKKQVAVLEKSLALEQEKLDAIAGVSSNLISDQEKKQQALLVDKLTAELEAAQTTVTQLEHTGQLGVRAAEANLEAARSAKEQIGAVIPTESLKVGKAGAEAQRDRAKLTTPIANGTVLAIYTQPGEQIANQPVLQIADLSKMVCIAEVYETDIKRVKGGQTAIIRSEVFPPEVNEKGIRGRVVQVGNMIASAKLQPLDPFARADRHVVEVRIELSPSTELEKEAAKLVNLQVDVTIETGAGGGVAVAIHEKAK